MSVSRKSRPHHVPRARVRRWLGVLLMVLAGTLRLGAGEIEDVRQEFLKGDYGSVAKTAAAGAKETPGDEEWHLIYIEALLATGRAEEADRALTEALGRVPQSLRLHWLGREVAFANGQPERAAKLLDNLRQLYANRPSAYRTPPDLVVFGRAALLLGADPKDVLTRIYAIAQKAAPKLRDTYLARGELALEKHDFALAATAFEDGLKQLPDDPDLNSGLARAHEVGDRKLMIAAIERALKTNPRHVPSLLLRADHAIDGERYAEAEEDLAAILAVNPRQPDAWALRAVLAHLRNHPDGERAARDAALRDWPTNPRVDWRIGQKLSLKYRFAEGAARQRQALQFDPEYLPAKAQLASDLLRLGEETEGWQLAQAVNTEDGYDLEAFNLVTLHDTMEKYATLKDDDFVVRMTAHEAAVYGPEVLALLGRARRTLTEKYGAELARPTYVDIFADPKDFAVRTFGLPDIPGFLGVCFGRVITANSPASTASSATNWQSVLWHEFCHVVTLQLTQNKMPRWLSEGISVYEERQASPAWGQHMTPVYREMILNKDGKDGLTPVGEMSAAFLAPPTPEHLQFAYFQASLVVEFLIEKHGLEKFRAVLKDLRDGIEINRALEQHVAPLSEIEKTFTAYAQERASALGSGLNWEKPAAELFRADAAAKLRNWSAAHPKNYWMEQRRIRTLLDDKQWAEAKVALNALLEKYPEPRGGDSALRMLAQAQRELGETVAERATLEKLAAFDGEAPDAYLRLIALGTAQKDWKDVALNARRFLQINPLVSAPWRALAQASAGAGDDVTAIAANRTLLLLDPANPAEIHFELARLLHHGNDGEARRQVLLALEDAPRHRAALNLLLELGAPPAKPMEFKASP
jgi:cytochrome c-type biogenesis protein CcmH/NrfG